MSAFVSHRWGLPGSALECRPLEALSEVAPGLAAIHGADTIMGAGRLDMCPCCSLHLQDLHQACVPENWMRVVLSKIPQESNEHMAATRNTQGSTQLSIWGSEMRADTSHSHDRCLPLEAHNSDPTLGKSMSVHPEVPLWSDKP